MANNEKNIAQIIWAFIKKYILTFNVLTGLLAILVAITCAICW